MGSRRKELSRIKAWRLESRQRRQTRMSALRHDSDSRQLLACLTLAVGAAAIEVDEDVARFSAFTGPNQAPVFQFVHDAGGPGVAQAQAALHQGDTGLLLAADDLDA